MNVADPQQYSDEAIVNMFYKLLPLFLSLLEESRFASALMSALITSNPTLGVLSYRNKPPEFDREKAILLLRQYREGKHLELDSLKEIDTGLSPEVRRLISKKEN